MELQDYLRVLRKRWLLVVAVTLITLGGSALATLLTPRTYSAQTQFFVSTAGGDNAGLLLQGNTFTQQRVKSYSQLLATPKVLGPVIASLKLDLSPDQLAQFVSSNIPQDTVLIEVTVSASSPELATRIAKAIGEQFPVTVDQLERVSEGSPSPVKVTLVRDPQASASPISPKPSRNLILGLALGLILGVAAALIRDLLDTTIRSRRDLEGITDASVIGTIGFDSDARAHPLIVQVDPKSQRAEAFRALRTNLRFVNAADDFRSIVVTSSLPGEGKTTTTANLALTLAANGGRVCVIEGDLRRPRLLQYFGYEGAIGLTDVLIGRADLDEVTQQFGASSLFVLGAGAIPPNPSELLGSPAMAMTLKSLESRFDYVLIDAPPLLPVTDAAVLSTMVGGALLVIGTGIITKDHLSHALEALEAVSGTVLGLVLNRLARDETAGYGYGYGYHYSSESPRRTAKQRSNLKHPQRSAIEASTSGKAR